MRAKETGTNIMRSRGQHERTNGKHQRHPARRQSHPPGPRIHPWLARAPIYRSRYAEVRREMLLESRTSADNFSTGTRPCSDLAALVVAVSVSPEVVPLSTAPVASAALPDKLERKAREHGITKISQSDLRLERETQAQSMRGRRCERAQQKSWIERWLSTTTWFYGEKTRDARRLAFSWRQDEPKRSMLSQMQHTWRGTKCGLHKLRGTLQFISLVCEP